MSFRSICGSSWPLSEGRGTEIESKGEVPSREEAGGLFSVLSSQEDFKEGRKSSSNVSSLRLSVNCVK